VEIRSGEPVRRSVAAVSTGLAKVEGVALRGKQPAAGAMVVLVPLNPAASDGTFTLAAVLPGDYTVIAVNDWTLQWASRRALQPYVSGGQRLHVEANKQYRASPQVQ